MTKWIALKKINTVKSNLWKDIRFLMISWIITMIILESLCVFMFSLELDKITAIVLQFCGAFLITLEVVRRLNESINKEMRDLDQYFYGYLSILEDREASKKDNEILEHVPTID